MNMKESPDVDELKALVAACDDNAGHHILWVSTDGEVRITILPNDINPSGFEQGFPNVGIRFSTFQRGNDYVGLEASKDEHFMSSLYRALVDNWGDGRVASKGSIYVDEY